MNTSRETKTVGYDIVGLLLFLFLVGGGWAMIFASEYLPEYFTQFLDFSKSYGKQLLFIMVCVGLFGIIQLLNARIFESFAIFLYIPALILLVAVLFTRPINGSTSWFDLGFFRLQPSEIAKLATSLFLSAFISRIDFNINDPKRLAQALGIIALPMGLVLLQGDLGSMLVFTSFAVVMYRAGFYWWVYALGFFILFLSIAALMSENINYVFNGLLLLSAFLLIFLYKEKIYWAILPVVLLISAHFFYDDYSTWYWISSLTLVIGLAILQLNNNWRAILFIFFGLSISFIYSSSVSYLVNNVLQKHQQERIWVWLKPEKCDPLGALYNVEQSKFAIGSGALFGKGYMQGERTKLDYVPEQSTDFIFCTVGEEWGFFGTFSLLFIFLLLLVRILVIAERQRDLFTRYYSYCIAGILFFHLFINIGMTIGAVPVVGIPLPFISYGGSSLISFCIQLSILFRLDSQRNF
jgi:rod shape determining protein RodA